MSNYKNGSLDRGSLSGEFGKAAALPVCVSACKFGSDSLSMIFGGDVVLFSKGNQQHGEEFSGFGAHPCRFGRRGHDRDRSGHCGRGSGGGAGESLPGVRKMLKTHPQPLYQDRFRPALCRSQG